MRNSAVLPLPVAAFPRRRVRRLLADERCCDTAFHRLSLPFTAFHCLSPPFTAFHRGTAVTIAAGGGEWVAEQCKAVPGADWAALELRHSRCAAIHRSIAVQAANIDCHRA